MSKDNPKITILPPDGEPTPLERRGSGSPLRTYIFLCRPDLGLLPTERRREGRDDHHARGRRIDLSV